MIAFKSTAQNTISGIVTDSKSGTPLYGATIAIPELKTGTVSDEKGKFMLTNLPAGKFLMQVTYIGYAAISRPVEIKGASEEDVSLAPSVLESQEVVVTGTSGVAEARKNPIPIALVNHQTLLQTPSTNIIDAINKVPGVSTLTTGPNVSKPYIRGLGYNRVLTLFDGVRQEGQQWGDEHGIEVDQFLIDHIEIVKGPASLIYGSDALGGVINLLPALPVPEGTIKGSFLANYQTNNKQIASSLAFDGNENGYVWSVRGSHKQASDYEDQYDGRVFGTKYAENDLNLYGGIHRSWGYSNLNFSIYDDLQEIPDGSRDSATGKFTKQISEADTVRQIASNDELNSYTIGVLHQHVQHYRLYSSSNFILGGSRLAVNLGAQQSIRREFSHPEYPDVAGLYLILNTFSYDIKYFLPEMNGWDITTGVNGMYQNNNAAKGTELVIPSYHSFDFGPFALIKKSVGKIDFAAGIRYDLRAFQNDSMFTETNPVTGFGQVVPPSEADSGVVKQFDYYKHTFSGGSGSVGATYNFSDRFGIKANFARGYRAPNAAEISAKGVHPGTGFEQLGDENFKPEFSLQEDVGAFWNTEVFSASIDLFNTNISNYIYDEKLQSVNGGDSIFMQDGNSYPVFKFRQTTAQLYGGEFSFDIHPLSWLHFENTVSYIDGINKGGNGAVITDSTRYLPLIPPLHTNTELRATRNGKLGFLTASFIQFGVEYYAAQNHFYSAYGTETYTPSYVLLNAGIGGNVVNQKGKTIFYFSILASNLGNAAYQSNMNRLKYFIWQTSSGYAVPGPTGHYGIYNMGRNISLTVNFPIDVKD